MQVRFLLGPAGSGKTFRCLSEARRALCASPEGLPLILVAPKQGTYQLEQQLLADPYLAGYTRLSILSFESLAHFVFKSLDQPAPPLLSAEGRVMVLRSLLAQNHAGLKVFRASARLTGFAQQLSVVLAEVERAGLDPAALRALLATLPPGGLALKVEDLATLFEHYQRWLRAHDLEDDDALLRAAAKLLRHQSAPTFRIEGLWVDGFAEFSELELELLRTLISRSEHATVTFCLPAPVLKKVSWLSHWSPISRTLEACRKHLGAVSGAEIVLESLDHREENRFGSNPILQHLETYWDAPRPYRSDPELAETPEASGSSSHCDDVPFEIRISKSEIRKKPQVRSPSTGASGWPRCDAPTSGLGAALRLVACPDREAEVILAAREILAFVRSGGRFRDASILVRDLEPYYQPIQRVLARYQIPFFLDRRESVAHHPLAELTRSAVRLAAFGWPQEDWFAALKSGLCPAHEEEIDLLETEALARGWKGQAWRQPIQLRDQPKTTQDAERLKHLEEQLETIRRKLLPPFDAFTLALGAVRHKPTGPELAAALRKLWSSLQIEEQLQAFSRPEVSDPGFLAGPSVQETVWRQLNSWLDNAELAFARQALPLREWVPILEAGLASLTVGVIPPALDQVLVGSVDRSRTPEVKLAVVLGLNESVFPATPSSGSLLTDSDRLVLESHAVVLGSSTRRQLGRERYLAYIACTRARQRLVLTWAGQDAAGAPLGPSSLLTHLEQLFPGLLRETAPPLRPWEQSEHPLELLPYLMSTTLPETATEHSSGPGSLITLPELRDLLGDVARFVNPDGTEVLAPELATRLYGPVLRTSVSRMEQFAACPFRFFVHSGLRAEERRLFELDIREQGTFQHDVLAFFHQELRTEGKRWRDITPAQARERVGQIARAMAGSFHDGLLETNEGTRFTARVMTEALQDFVETLLDWMQEQYQFDPVEVELPFGENGSSPGWNLDLGADKRLELYGRIDRIDLFRLPGTDRALGVVIDYKSSHKQLDPLLVSHGLQLQLLAYLNVVRQWPNPQALFGVQQVQPAGVFYVNLRGKYGSERNRADALADPAQARKLAYRHSGRFDVRALPQLDGRAAAVEGDQFNYRRNKDGQVSKVCKEAVAAADFEALLAQVTDNLRVMGQEVYLGRAEVGPFRRGAITACDQCTYQAICRIDPWIHKFRLLRPGGSQGSAEVPQGSDLL